LFSKITTSLLGLIFTPYLNLNKTRFRFWFLKFIKNYTFVLKVNSDICFPSKSSHIITLD
jgi:hypothetical protein